jgi:hypothetical protein
MVRETRCARWLRGQAADDLDLVVVVGRTVRMEEIVEPWRS